MPVFFFTDIEGSTRLWEIHRQAMVPVLQQHDVILAETLQAYGGRIIDHRGDGVYAVFEAGDPLSAAVALQRRFEAQDWGDVKEVRVRIGLHGCTEERAGQDYFTSDDDFYGPIVNHAARIMDTAWGGQIVLAPAVLDIVPLPPGAAIQDLGRHTLKSLDEPQEIFGLLHPDLPRTSFPPLRSLSLYRHNLPRQNATFVGREAELHATVNFITRDNGRLLTLVGPGGSGKTRLAIQAAAEAIDDFPQGVFFVSLTAVSRPELLVPAIADVLEFSFYPGLPLKLQLLNYLREKRLLLILDNFEHLLAGRDLLEELLWRAPQIKILVTSRERLGLDAEQLLTIGGLSVPPLEEGESLPSRHDLEAYSAVQLFVQAARRAQPEFSLTDEDRAAVIRLCELVDGLPLALELAAAWVRLLDCTTIADRIAEYVGLETRGEGADRASTVSLTAVCSYFWSFLGEAEQATSRELSIFEGSFTPEAGEAVAGASFFLLAALVEKAFLQLVNPAGQSGVRYAMHVALQRYAAGRLRQRPSESHAAAEAHATYYAGRLADLAGQLSDERQKSARRELGVDRANYLAAWQWALDERRLGLVDTMLDGLFYYYRLQTRAREGLALFGEAAERLRSGLASLDGVAKGENNGQGADTAREEQQAGWRLVVKLQNRQAYFEQQMADFSAATRRLEENVALARRLAAPAEEAFALTNLGVVDGQLGRYAPACERLVHAVDLYRRQGDVQGVAGSLLELAQVWYQRGHYETAERLGQEALDIYEVRRDRRGLAVANNLLGLFAGRRGGTAEAQRYLRRSLTLHEELDDQVGVSAASANLGTLALARGQYAAARAYHRRSLQIARTMGNPWAMVAALDNMGLVALATLNLPEARRRFAEALALAEQTGSTPLILNVLVGVAEVMSLEQRIETGVKLLLFVESQPHLDRMKTAGRAETTLAPLVRSLPEETRRRWVESVSTWVLDDALTHARQALMPAAIPVA